MENKSKAADKGRQNNGEIDVSTAKERERERDGEWAFSTLITNIFLLAADKHNGNQL
jgi:hypothetical protein